MLHVMSRKLQSIQNDVCDEISESIVKSQEHVNSLIVIVNITYLLLRLFLSDKLSRKLQYILLMNIYTVSCRIQKVSS